jgi:hypothetical protein
MAAKALTNIVGNLHRVAQEDLLLFLLALSRG